MAPTWQMGKDPLAWITQELVEFEGIPGSHAWKWRQDGIWRARLVTKTQVIGVLVSIQERAERVEFLVDDGTALVKAVLWSASPWHKSVGLGDLVHVEGKLNMDKKWNNHDASLPSREIRVVRIAKVEDPNEELLHWVHVMEFSKEVYSANVSPATATTGRHVMGKHAEKGSNTSGSSVTSQQETDTWDQIVMHAFFQLTLDAEVKAQFLKREKTDPHDGLLVEILEDLLQQQQQKAHLPGDAADATAGDSHAVRIVFIDTLEKLVEERHATQAPPSSSSDQARNKLIRDLRKVFAVLRASGLLFLEDTDSDRHVLLSFAFVLKPALLRILQDQESGMSVVEMADWVFTQSRFQRIPIEWLEISLQQLLRDKQIRQREDSQRFHAVD